MALNSSHSPHPRAKALPPVEFYARIKGAIEWVCPKCGRFMRTHIVSWRRPRAICRHRHCHQVIGFGVAASHFQPAWRRDFAPYSARYNQAAAPRLTVNHLGKLSDSFTDAIGQIIGAVEWWCPNTDCEHQNISVPDPKTGAIVCKKCFLGLNVSLLLLKTLPGAHRITPIDWIPPRPELGA